MSALPPERKACAADDLAAPANRGTLRLPYRSGEYVRERLARLGVKLPLAMAEDGTIVDADNEQIAVIDCWRERPDQDVAEIGRLFVASVNARADQVVP